VIGGGSNSYYSAMKYLTNVILTCAIIFAFSPWAAAHETAKLKDAHIEFKTGGKKKRSDTKVVVQVYCRDGSLAAKNDPVQTYGEFPHYSKSRPIVLVVDSSKAKFDIKGGYHMIRIEPAGDETWTFTYVLTLDFDDGTHLVYGRNNRTATQDDNTVRGKNL
jgi:hypothetical protein